MAEATDPTPGDGWVCFHCGERLTTPGAARDHFGFQPSDDPACRIKIGEESWPVTDEERARLKDLGFAASDGMGWHAFT